MSSTREVVQRNDHDLAYSIVEQMGLGLEFRNCSCGQLPCARLQPIVSALQQREQEVRERCAKIAEKEAQEWSLASDNYKASDPMKTKSISRSAMAHEIAAAIRRDDQQEGER